MHVAGTLCTMEVQVAIKPGMQNRNVNFPPAKKWSIQ